MGALTPSNLGESLHRNLLIIIPLIAGAGQYPGGALENTKLLLRIVGAGLAGQSTVARMRLEPFRECRVVRLRWKFQTQSTVDALQKTAFRGH